MKSYNLDCVAPSGIKFPAAPRLGEFFYKTGHDGGLYFYTPNGWAPLLMDNLPLQDPSFDSGWIIQVGQVITLKHNLNTRNFKLITITGMDDKMDFFPTWTFGVTSAKDISAGHVVQVLSLNEITVATFADGGMIAEPSLNWNTNTAKYIKVRLWA